jgi:hypothetical protein
LEVETEGMETTEIAVAAMIETAAVVTAKTVAVTEKVAAVMTMAEKVVADGNDGEGGSRQ